MYVCVDVAFGVAPTISRCELQAASDVITHLMTSSPIEASYVRTDTLKLTCDVTGVPKPTYVPRLHFSRSCCYTVSSAIGIILSSVCLAVCLSATLCMALRVAVQG